MATPPRVGAKRSRRNASFSEAGPTSGNRMWKGSTSKWEWERERKAALRTRRAKFARPVKSGQVDLGQRRDDGKRTLLHASHIAPDDRERVVGETISMDGGT